MIKRYKDYDPNYEMAYEFVNSFNSIIKESDSKNKDWENILNKFKNDLKLNLTLIGTFGTGIGAFVPVVQQMMINMNISTVITLDKAVLLTICTLTIIYLEEKKFKSSKEEQELISDSKSMLEELKMMGIGNGIVKLIIKSFESIKKLFNSIGKHIGVVVGNIMDMFAYASFLLPVMNGIFYLIGQYNMTPDTMVQNLIGLTAGLSTLIAKHGISYVITKIGNKFKLKKSVIDDIVDDIDNSTIQKFNVYDHELDIVNTEVINDKKKN